MIINHTLLKNNRCKQLMVSFMIDGTCAYVHYIRFWIYISCYTVRIDTVYRLYEYEDAPLNYIWQKISSYNDYIDAVSCPCGCKDARPMNAVGERYVGKMYSDTDARLYVFEC
eukprot:778668_1